MSFVDLHYTSTFRELVSSKTGGVSSLLESGDQSPEQIQQDTDKLVKRAFDLSTMLLSILTSRSDTSNHSSVADISKSLTTGINSNAVNCFSCPSLATVANDLQLVEDVGTTNINHGNSSSAADLVLMNAVSAIHAHTIEQLLDTVLPLSLDLDYWNSQDGNSLSLLMYFIQSLPHRLFDWGSRTLNEAAGSLERFSIRHLFPDVTTTISNKQFKVPRGINLLGLTRREVKYKQSQLGDIREKVAGMIGELSQVGQPGNNQKISINCMLQQITTVLNSLKLSNNTVLSTVSANNLVRVTKSTLLQVQSISKDLARQISPYRRPSLLTRSWIPALVILFSLRRASAYISEHRDDFKGWAADGMVAIHNYISQYMLEPLRSAYETIRYGKHTYSVMSQESLLSDLKSLEDMVIGFSQRGESPVDIGVIKQRVESGDLSDVMTVYAQELKKPFRNAVFGDLVQAMLIQVQKVKVDVGQTMAALDKLLKSNELNFLLLSTVPATISIYAGLSWLSSWVSWWVSGSSRSTTASIQTIVRDIDRLLNIDESREQLSAPVQGRLICLTHYLRHHAQQLPNGVSSGRLRTANGWCYTLPRTQTLFVQDICDLESPELSSCQRRNVVERIYRTYRFL